MTSVRPVLSVNALVVVVVFLVKLKSVRPCCAILSRACPLLQRKLSGWRGGRGLLAGDAGRAG